MHSDVVQCLHHSKLMLMYAEKQDWDTFTSLHPQWESEINACLIETPTEAGIDVEEMKKVLAELIEDIDKIRNLIMGRMYQIESEFSQTIQQKKAMDSYLK